MPNAELCRANLGSCEILAAAARLDVVLSEHAVVLQRAKAAVSELDTRISAAQASGAPQAFNAEYRKRRLLAKNLRS
jgi:hypothetical protein